LNAAATGSSALAGDTSADLPIQRLLLLQQHWLQSFLLHLAVLT
jgi:hypothetical protein